MTEYKEKGYAPFERRAEYRYQKLRKAFLAYLRNKAQIAVKEYKIAKRRY